jgi:glucan 1,3-beta-glucosidase
MMMGLFRSAVISALMLVAAGEHFSIPEIDNVVASVLQKSNNYVHFHSNTTEHSAVQKRASSYWYENIAHQGISAFGPAGYAVYRNVKDFGATGSFPNTSSGGIH